MSMGLGNAATVFQVTRLTEASFIVSTPTRAGRLADASVDRTDARENTPPEGAASSHRGVVKHPVELVTPKQLEHVTNTLRGPVE
jgi:hypothetical protein